MGYPIAVENLKKELSEALNVHIKLLKDVQFIESEHMDAFTFMMRSFGFMLDRAPRLLVENDTEEMYYAMFQYYNLLAELKKNLTMNFPHAQLHGQSFSLLLAPFPQTYEKEVNQWWESTTGLTVNHNKQTMNF